jgi:hypothetical protein
MKPTVNRARLIETLRANRDTHHAVYTQAVAVYRQEMVTWHQRQVAAIQDGREVHRHVGSSLPEPEDHTDDYDRAIQMLEWETGDTVELHEEEFMNLVLDEWHWTGRWQASTSSYTSR